MHRLAAPKKPIYPEGLDNSSISAPWRRRAASKRFLLQKLVPLDFFREDVRALSDQQFGRNQLRFLAERQSLRRSVLLDHPFDGDAGIALIRWSAEDLARETALSVTFIRRATEGETSMTAANDLAVRRAAPRDARCHSARLRIGRRGVHRRKQRRPWGANPQAPTGERIAVSPNTAAVGIRLRGRAEPAGFLMHRSTENRPPIPCASRWFI